MGPRLCACCWHRMWAFGRLLYHACFKQQRRLCVVCEESERGALKRGGWLHYAPLRCRRRRPPFPPTTPQAWLDPVHLPSKPQLTCAATGEPLRFLLQVYSPQDTHPGAFHRTVYVFVSPRGDTLSQPGAVRALRCQLARRNKYYSFEPAGAGEVVPPELKVGRGGVGGGVGGWGVSAVLRGGEEVSS